MDDAIAVFFSYFHADETLRDELAKYLTILERLGVIKSWHDRRILAGDEWDGEEYPFVPRQEPGNVLLRLGLFWRQSRLWRYPGRAWAPGTISNHASVTSNHASVTSNHTGATSNHTGVTSNHTGVTSNRTGATTNHAHATINHACVTGNHAGTLSDRKAVRLYPHRGIRVYDQDQGSPTDGQRHSTCNR